MSLDEYEELMEINEMLGLAQLEPACEDVDLELTDEEKAEAEAWLKEPDAPVKPHRDDDGFDF